MEFPNATRSRGASANSNVRFSIALLSVATPGRFLNQFSGSCYGTEIKEPDNLHGALSTKSFNQC
jgi:hypothetical protein